eukprot:IDg10129t1
MPRYRSPSLRPGSSERDCISFVELMHAQRTRAGLSNSRDSVARQGSLNSGSGSKYLSACSRFITVQAKKNAGSGKKREQEFLSAAGLSIFLQLVNVELDPDDRIDSEFSSGCISKLKKCNKFRRHLSHDDVGDANEAAIQFQITEIKAKIANYA